MLIEISKSKSSLFSKYWMYAKLKIMQYWNEDEIVFLKYILYH